ncbi:MAG TPA: acetyl-CoA carboxylase biotin carboxyl carrier protein [Acidobacteriaceae bacterium]|jgi:acetyl-CoA carboxylase biotin carboxyl carrier protein|nr:acetyl-CoA carboxylase biotin carboxyl carrier protein [Acidobacteriaceae bacterium]
MTPEESKELRELVEFLKENNIGEFEMERADVKIRIRFGSPAQAAGSSALDLARLSQLLASGQAVPAQAASAPSTDAAAAEDADLHIVKSPIVGTFFESPSPGAPAFVKIGDRVEDGQVLCIVEAMKLMNEIEADAAGEIVKRLVANGQPVEYGQPLFALRRS